MSDITAALREWIANEPVAAVRDGLTVIADGIDEDFAAALAESGDGHRDSRSGR